MPAAMWWARRGALGLIGVGGHLLPGCKACGRRRRRAGGGSGLLPAACCSSYRILQAAWCVPPARASSRQRPMPPPAMCPTLQAAGPGGWRRPLGRPLGLSPLQPRHPINPRRAGQAGAQHMPGGARWRGRLLSFLLLRRPSALQARPVWLYRITFGRFCLCAACCC